MTCLLSMDNFDGGFACHVEPGSVYFDIRPRRSVGVTVLSDDSESLASPATGLEYVCTRSGLVLQ